MTGKMRWELYRSNIRKNARFRGIGLDMWRLRGYTLPTLDEMRRMDKFNLYDIDPLIRTAVIELNERGLATRGSCSGHAKDRGCRGFITFAPETFKEGIATEVLRKYGLKRMVLEKPGWVYLDKERVRSAHYAITFTSLDRGEAEPGAIIPKGRKVPEKLKKRL